jgi:hypothetical protein
MSDPVKEVAEVVDDVVTEPEIVPENLPNPHITDRPPWVDELVTAITSIPDSIAEKMGNPVNPGDDLGDDESPIGKPWTHRGFGSK